MSGGRFVGTRAARTTTCDRGSGGSRARVLTLPRGDVGISGEIEFAGRRIRVHDHARGAQAHLWGNAHAESWAWARCGHFQSEGGEPVPDTFVDGVSVRVRRFGRELGPATPVVGRVAGEDFESTSPLRVLRNRVLVLRGRLAVRGARGLAQADRGGPGRPRRCSPGSPARPRRRPAYCYNSEAASMRLRCTGGPPDGNRSRRTLVGPGRAHFEYAHGRRSPAWIC